jgi:type IV secretion system protein VirD4
MGLGFAAGFNLQLWPFLQDLPQLEFLYGKQWMSILANCGLMQFFAGSFFKQERSESRVPLLPLEQMMSLPADRSAVFFAGTHDPLIAGRAPYWRIPRLAGMFDPDPYHR